MCGIAGVVLPALGHEARQSIVESMCRALAHRGPDGGGVFVGGPAAIGMRRLAIVDVEHGRQPMIGRDGDVALVFNGEIYNAPELRTELQADGVRFETRSDTEVILRLYERDPEDLERRLNGMWAFAVLDLRRRRILLSRDRFGIKPLFIAQPDGALAFASELRALRPLRSTAAFEPALDIDRSAAHAMLAWGYVPNERTILSGVRRLAPATRMTFDLASGVSQEQRYWRPSPARLDGVRTAEDAAALVEGALRASVREHLRSDVPVATFVSGGIDSSLIAAYAADIVGAPLDAFAVGFDEPRYDERPYAREVAAKLGASLTEVTIAERDVGTLVLNALEAYDEPFGDSSSIATYAVSRACATRFKVALGGDGGDEGFAGYRKHRMVAVRDVLHSFDGIRRSVADVLLRLPAPVDRERRIGDLLRKVRRVARSLGGADATAYRALTQVDALARARDLVVGADDAHTFEQELERRFVANEGTQLQRTLTTDLENTLPNDLLTKVDRASMACSLEVRVPFLDHRVFELGLGLPLRATLGLRGKEVLRLLCARRFDRAVAYRPKHGFEVPVERWVRGPLAAVCDDAFSDTALERHGVLSPQTLSHGRWRQLLGDRPQLAWHALALATWCRRWTTTDVDTVPSIGSTAWNI